MSFDAPEHQLQTRAPRALDVATEHTLKNHLAIIVGYCELLLAETRPDDPHHADIVEMHRAALAVLALFAHSGN